MTAKVKMKTYANAKVREKTSTIKIGDRVLARQKKHNKLSTCFDPLPFRVVCRNGTMITARRNGKYITHNVSHFKVVDPVFQGEQLNDEEEEDDDIVSIQTPTRPNASDANVKAPQSEFRPYNCNRRHVDRFGHFVYGQ